MDSEWQEFIAIAQMPLVDGDSSSGPLMRRKVGTEWQYRRMTDEEEADWTAYWAW